MTSLQALALAAIVLSVSAGVAPQWSVSHSAPYSGNVAVTSTTSGSSSAMSFINRTNFSLVTGSGGFAATDSLTSLGSGFVQSTIALEFNLTFKNHSGTRTLHFVNITYSWSVVGNLTFVPGICPWNKALRLPNECTVEVQASDWITSNPLSYGSGARGTGIPGRCLTGCGRAGPGGANGTILVEKNSSKGLRIILGSPKSTNLSLSIHATTIESYVFVKNLTKSTRIHLFLTSVGNLTTVMQALASRGGLSGAHVSANLSFSIKVNSITEFG